MTSYEDKMKNVLNYLKEPGLLSPTGFSPIVYLVYEPEDVFIIRNEIESVLLPTANYQQFTPHIISLGELIDNFINHNKYLSFWTDPEVSEKELYESIAQDIKDEEYLEKELLSLQDKYVSEQQPLLILKDLEVLHPFSMIGVIENKIYNQIRVPTIILYPGEMQGTARSFLGIYNQDGNYRSICF